MTRQVRNIVIAVCVTAILGGSLLLLDTLPGGKKSSSSSSTSSTSSSSSISLLSYKSSDLKSLRVTNTLGTYNIALSGGTYTVDTLQEAPTNQSTIQSKAADVLGLKATSLIQKDASDLSQYGLANPTATLVLTTADGKSNTVKIGNKAPSGNGVYILKPGTNDVYLSSTMQNDDFTQSPLVYASVTVSSLSTSARLSAYQFGGASRSTQFTVAVKEDTSSSSSTSSSASASYTYSVSQPFSYAANTTNVAKITTALQSLSATNVASVDVSDASLEKYGLLHPAYTLTYTVDGQNTVLSFGNVDTGSNLVYTMISGKKAIYAVDTASAAAFYNDQLSDVLSTSILSADISTIKSITVQGNGETHSFTLSGSSDKLAVQTAGGKKLNIDNFRNYYENLLAVTTRGGASKPSSGSPSLTITVTYNDNTPQQAVSFIPLDSDKSFVQINGVGALYVYNSQISSLLTLTQNVEAGKTVQAPS